MNMRKSQTSDKAIIGNAEKFEAYREAWSRIKLAQENHFFLEAITIQESIISDRLISFLSRPTAPKILARNRRGRLPSFGSLIKDYWREEFPDPLKSGVYPDLIGWLPDTFQEIQAGCGLQLTIRTRENTILSS